MQTALLTLSGLIALIACGGGTAPASATPDNISVGDVDVGGSTARNIKLTNTSAGPLTIKDVVTAGGGLVASGRALPISLAAGESANLLVELAPTTSGDISGSVEFLSADATTSVSSFRITGRGVHPKSLVAAPATIAFGDVTVGESATETVTLTNDTIREQRVTNLAVSAAGVTAVGLPLPATFAPGESATVTLTFKPNAAGGMSGSVAVKSDQGRSLAAVSLSGQGVSSAAAATLTAAPTRVAFGDVTVGGFSAQSVTVTNASQAAVTVSDVVTTGAGFTSSGLSPATTIAPGGSATITAKYTPEALGAAAGQISVRTAGQVEPLAVVDLAGSGVEAASITSVTARDATVEASQTVQVQADVVAVGTIDKSVSWNVDPTSLGTIDATSGIYTAPAVPGTYKVWATSNADPSKKGVASVTVTAPPTSTTPTPSPSLPPGVVPAFPGAEGGGANSEGGRGGAVYEVTNLNDSGAGSLRACVEASGPRTCVFRVAGRIQLASKIRITNPYLTVAGQTAPGGGITISGTTISGSWSNSMFHISTHDVVFRYLRLRRGDNPVASSGLAFFVENDAYNLVFDHLSLSWSQQEPFAVFPARAGTNSISIQWSMLFDTLVHWYVEENHNVSLSLSAYTPAAAAAVTDVDLHHNYITDGSRLPLFKLKSGSLVNNVIYNWSYFATLSGGGVMLDIVGNRYKAGPRTPSSGPSSYEIDAYNNTACPDNQGPCGTPSLYVAGNTKKDGTIPGDQWSLTSQTSGEAPDGSSPVPSSWRRADARAIRPDYVAITTTSPAIAEAAVIAMAGASQRLGCDGTWVANRDTIDATAIVEYTTNTGTYKWTEADAGGFPSIVAGTACADTDHDGIPDAYEQAACGMSTCLDGNAVQADGYTNLEKYLNGR